LRFKEANHLTMKYIYGIFIGFLAVAALAWVIHLGIEGKPVAKIKLSEFQSNREIAEAVNMRLRQELKDHSVVFLGVDPEEPAHLQIWKEFLQLAIEPGWKFDEILIEKALGESEPWGLGEINLDVKEQEAELKTRWSSEGYKSKRVAVVVPHIYASQLIKDNPVQRLKLNPNEGRMLSITIVPLAQKADAPEVNRLPCAADGADYTGQSPLGCVIRKRSMFWNKPLKEGVRLGLVEQFGLHDYILFFRNSNSN
jgi:hypothetical protein